MKIMTPFLTDITHFVVEHVYNSTPTEELSTCVKCHKCKTFAECTHIAASFYESPNDIKCTRCKEVLVGRTDPQPRGK